MLADIKPYMSFFYDDIFELESEIPDQYDREDIKSVLSDFANSYDTSADNNAWFENIKSIGAKYGYTPDMKAYKEDPSAFKGSVADVSMFIRVAVTGKINSPDLYTVMQILGKERTLNRINNMMRKI